MFASDQLGTLIEQGGIGQLGTDAEKQVKEQNGDLEINSVTGTDGKLYGVPYTDNTWFMYYNKSKITADEAKDFDAMLAKAKVTFPMSNSWVHQRLLRWPDPVRQVRQRREGRHGLPEGWRRHHFLPGRRGCQPELQQR